MDSKKIIKRLKQEKEIRRIKRQNEIFMEVFGFIFILAVVLIVLLYTNGGL